MACSGADEEGVDLAREHDEEEEEVEEVHGDAERDEGRAVAVGAEPQVVKDVARADDHLKNLQGDDGDGGGWYLLLFSPLKSCCK